MLMAVLLICCSLLRYASPTLLACGENLTRPEPHGKSKIRESRADMRLPWCTAGFD